MSAANDNGFKLAYTVKEAIEATGLGKTTLYQMIGDGRLRVVKIGTRTLIPRSSLAAIFGEPPAAA